MLFLIFEVILVILDVIGQNKRDCVLAAFILSSLASIVTIYACIKGRTGASTALAVEKQLGVVEVTFSLMQVMATLLHFILVVLGVKFSYNIASLLSLAFAVIGVVFVFKKNEEVIESSSSYHGLISSSQSLRVLSEEEEEAELLRQAGVVLQASMSRLKEEISHMVIRKQQASECVQAYVVARKYALDKCLSIFKMDKTSIEDLLKLDWGRVQPKIQRWVHVIKLFVSDYLANEKWLSCHTFREEFGQAGLTCFVEASKASIMQLLSFVKAITSGPHQPQKLFGLLDMYNVLANCIPEIDALYTEEVGLSIRIESHEALRRLGDYVRATFSGFENAVASHTTTKPFSGGGIHHVTRYVMNYIKNLTDYREILNALLKDDDKAASSSLLSNTSEFLEEKNLNESSSRYSSPMFRHFLSITLTLELNLHEKSKLFKDVALQHLFMMNNLHYMSQMVKNSELRPIFGDNWVRKHAVKLQHYAMHYRRASWSSVLHFLKDDGNSGSEPALKTKINKALQSFYDAFKEVYETQTAWVVSDVQLQEDLRISISLKVVAAFRAFMKKNANLISDNQIIGSPEDLEKYLLDLFAGLPKSLT